MLESIVSHGLALGAVYALIGITYNVMFAASRVFSFTAGTVGMLGGVFGALFIVNTVCLLKAINSEARETITDDMSARALVEQP